MANSRKLITFDLDTLEFTKHYPNKDISHLYNSIKTYLQKNGFDWVQGSGYISVLSISFNIANNILSALSKQQLHLQTCMRNCIVSNIGKIYDVTNTFIKNKLLNQV